MKLSLCRTRFCSHKPTPLCFRNIHLANTTFSWARLEEISETRKKLHSRISRAVKVAPFIRLICRKSDRNDVFYRLPVFFLISKENCWSSKIHHEQYHLMNRNMLNQVPCRLLGVTTVFHS